MKINRKIKIDLKEFIRTGKFHLLELGMTKEEVLDVIPTPEDWEDGEDAHTSKIWRYGNFELAFHEDKLWMIFNDYISSLDGGKHFNIDPWVLNFSQSIKISNFIGCLIEENIDFEKTTNSLGQVILTAINTGIRMTFDRSEEQDALLDDLSERISITDQDAYEKAYNEMHKSLDPNEFILAAISKMAIELTNS